MANGITPLVLEKNAYQEFHAMHRAGNFSGQRLGQAFYNHFKLHRLSDQQQLKGLYEADGKSALKIIERVFTLS
ncbi:hypothetical protein ABH908_005944 [Pseudomonas frederiksbergensis]|jgi:hypothetical protein|uniref:hypothetical protein n=1 Tax=Pseudomonas TaxID=286 RepID=UPI0007E3B540|nr:MULTISPECIES: hypothetical protein [unclassified Pseudomonas]MBD9618318.1 hypothetical protein [Pseudomonas sp. PDM07]QDV98088.1 hypothetical protein FFH90_028740 [Pseudomonas sp. ATCC 43928]WLG53908.1 hypothetical protein PSH64_28205 [Pseudomonas sp. FP1742]